MTNQSQAKSPIEAIEEFARELSLSADELSVDGDRSAKTTDANIGYQNIRRIPVALHAVLGNSSMDIAKLMSLGRGEVVPLDRKVGEPIDLVVNDVIIARGEITLLDQATQRLGVTITEIVTHL